MAIFVDSSDPAEIREFLAWGIISGITTNPKIIANELGAGRLDLRSRVREIAELADVPVSVELTAESEAGMLEQARAFKAWHPNLVVKVPLAPAFGLRVVRRLEREEGVRCNATCLMTFLQGYLAALAGATYVSLFWCRIRDAGQDAAAQFQLLRRQLDAENLAARIIAGSVREPADVAGAFAAGAHIVTVTPAVLRRCADHPRTRETIAEFNALWERLKDKGQLA